MAVIDFDQIYHDQKQKVWQLVCRYVVAQADREDLFQEVFFRIHRALPGFRAESGLATWVYRITVNTALNYLKKQKRYAGLKELLSRFRLIEAGDQEEAKDPGSLQGPLAKLNPQQRMVLIMADVEERKLNEISELLNLPLGTVKSNLARAREIIKKELKGDA